MTPQLIASCFLVLIGAAAGCALAESEGPRFNSAAISDGKLLANRECSSCHATGTTGASPRADAPLFRTILSRYHSDTLETELVQGIKLGHPDMPLFELNPKAVANLIVYLKSIQQN